MTGEAQIQFVGTITADPELRQAGGASVASFSVAVNGRRYDKDSGEYVDKDATFFRCSAWRTLGENTAQSLHKGDRVQVTGTVEERPWIDKEGNERRSMEVTVEQIGPSLQFATAQVQRAVRNQNQQARGQQRQAQRGNGNMVGRSGPQGRPQQQQQQDPWGAQGNGGWADSGDDYSEVPF